MAANKMNVDRRVDQHYGLGVVWEKIETGLKLAGKDTASLSVNDLAPIDEFHTRGRESTLEVAELARLKASDRVLDVGCGLGGTARYLAECYGCQVEAIDLTREYVLVGRRLTELVGLSDRVEHRQGSGLDLPSADSGFDVVWTEHVQMNIADKTRFYSEIARVLRPAGRLLFHDIFLGRGGEPFYPVPWAEEESISALVTEAEARSTMDLVGLEIRQWIGKVSESLQYFERVLGQIESKGTPPLGIHLLMGDNARTKLQNYLRNLRDGRVSVALGMAQKR